MLPGLFNSDCNSEAPPAHNLGDEQEKPNSPIGGITGLQCHKTKSDQAVSPDQTSRGRHGRRARRLDALGRAADQVLVGLGLFRELPRITANWWTISR